MVSSPQQNQREMKGEQPQIYPFLDFFWLWPMLKIRRGWEAPRCRVVSVWSDNIDRRHELSSSQQFHRHTSLPPRRKHLTNFLRKSINLPWSGRMQRIFFSSAKAKWHLETRCASLCLVYRYQKIKAWRITHWVCPKMRVPLKTRQHEICIYSYYINDLSVSVPKANKPQTLATTLGRSWDLMNRLFPFRVAHSVHLKQPRRHPSP